MNKSVADAKSKELNNANIKTAQPGDVLRDPEIAGLHLRCFEGRKSFYLYFRTKTGKERKPKLGDFGAITLSHARKAAQDILASVAAGLDPVAEWGLIRDCPLVSAMCDKFFDEYASKKKSWKDDKRHIDLYIKPRLGKMRVMDVTYDDVMDLHEHISEVGAPPRTEGRGKKSRKPGAPVQANRVHSTLRKMFNEARKWRDYKPYIKENPCDGVAHNDEQKRRRYMKGEEPIRIAESLRKLEGRYPGQVAFIWLLIYTGARCGEIAATTWALLDGNTIRLPDSKTGEPRDIHLPPQVMALLAKLPRTTGSLTGVKYPKQAWDQVRKEVGCRDLRLHDLRRTFASFALSAGYELSQVGELLGHSSAQTTKRYAFLVEEVAKTAVERTADKLQQAMAGAVPASAQ